MGLLTGTMAHVGDWSHNNYLPLAHYVTWFGLLGFSWALLTPFLFLFTRKFPFTHDVWLRRTLQYALVTLILLFAQPTIDAGLGWLVYPPDRHQSWFDTVAFEFDNSHVPVLESAAILYLLAAYQNAKREARRRRLREAQLESRVASAELEMLRMQLHPHFLFNTLQAATILVHEDPAAAERVLLRLSELLRVALSDMQHSEVPLEQELKFLEHYVEIQKQRFQERLEVRIDTPPETLSIKVPSLLLQPLVENAIHHGIGHIKGTDTVIVFARTAGDTLILDVNNYASTLSAEAESRGHGMGLRNVRARLEQMYGDRASVQLTSLEPKGVRARVTVPINAEART